MFKNAIRALLESIGLTVNEMGQNSGLLLDLPSWNASLSAYSNAISSSVVMPVALTLLSLFIMLELYNMAKRVGGAGGGSNVFTIQQIFLTMLKLILCKEAVTYSTQILELIMHITGEITAGISGYVGSGQVSSVMDTDALMAALESGIGAQISAWSSLTVVSILLRIVSIVINTIVAARFIELYVYNAMAPLSIATLCYQELHGVGVNFLKSYTAVALQGCVLYLVIGFYPALTASLGTGGDDLTSQAWGLLGQSVILLIAVLMSGKFTKAITNAMA